MHRMTRPDADDGSRAEIGYVPEFDFVPDALRRQCLGLVKTYHAMHGYSCLPNILWKAGLSGFIEKHRSLREAMKKASTTRSARTANELFALIATEALSLEVLARDYANWSAMLPAAKIRAVHLLEERTPPSRTWLMEHYLYPPRYDSPIATMMVAPVDPHAATNAATVQSSGAKSFRDIVMAHRRAQAPDPAPQPTPRRRIFAAQNASKA